MSDALEEHDGKVSICTSLWFADDIDDLAEEEQELEALVSSLGKTCTWYKMEICPEKTKLMTNRSNGIQREITVTGQKHGTLTSLSTWEQSFQMKAENRRFSQGLHKPPLLRQR